jgi:shikimate kinase
MKISLIGYMGSGKSTVGQQLAADLQLPWIDLDKRIEEASGYSITETILNKGELFFRKIEREQLLQALQQDSFVMSTGGGTPCYYDNVEEMNKHSLTVYLEYSVPELYELLEGNQADRPLIAHLEGDSLREYIGKHLFERAPYYERATFSLKAAGKSKEEIVNEIKELVL